MGCATSKQPVCRNCQAACSPPMQRRSYSMHGGGGNHHLLPDDHHVVALTSSTLGSLRIDESRDVVGDEKREAGNYEEEFSMGLIEAKTWSSMINEKIPKIVPKTPVRTPPGEPETINAWELMEGLEDTSPFRSPNHFRSFSFHVASNTDKVDSAKSKPMWLELGEDESTSSSNSNSTSNSVATSAISEFEPDKVDSVKSESQKPMWLELVDKERSLVPNSDQNATSVISEFDPDVISAFRKALEDLPAASPFHLTPLEGEKQQATMPLDETDVTKVDIDYPARKRVLLYFTSLRGVRKTYEDCCNVRVILKGMGVRVDERDVSMHLGFKEELKELLGDGFNGFLPKVLVGEKNVGGAEEIRRLHEEGQLEKVLEGCEMVDDGGGRGGGVCEGCGDVRFVPCETCSGSCKIYYEGDFDEDCEESEFGFQRCPDCNENGIVRCPVCCDQ